MKLPYCLSAFLAFTGPALLAQTIQWTSGTGANNHYYTLIAVPGGTDWNTAKTAAENAGGYLATLTSVEEKDFVYTNLASLNSSVWFIDGASNTEGPWLGGYQPNGSPEPGGGWSWVTGETWSYTNWTSGEPNNNGGNEDYLVFFGLGASMASTWNDVPLNGGMRGYVIESLTPIPEPAHTALLVALAGLGLVRWRQRRLRPANPASTA